MKKIKSFVYLDNYKMYSISSQIFEGLTDYIIKSNGTSSTENDSQKGKLGSGRIMADIIENNTSFQEKKFLHDYSYVLFEEALINEGKVLDINQSNLSDKIKEIEKFSFVKVTGKVIFNDAKLLESLLNKYNDVGMALTIVTEQSALEELKQKTKETINDIKDPNQRAKAKGILNSKINYNEIAKQKGLQLDKEYVEKLKYLINFGYNEQFELLLPLSDESEFSLFSGILKRELFTESELNIIKKYSRETEKEFSIFGILTQINTESEKINALKQSSNEDSKGMKEALLNLTTTFTNVERTFHGKLPYEYIIDPIAVYREL